MKSLNFFAKSGSERNQKGVYSISYTHTHTHTHTHTQCGENQRVRNEVQRYVTYILVAMMLSFYSYVWGQSCQDDPSTNTFYTKYVRLNFHFILDDNGVGNFRRDDDGLGNPNFTAYHYVNNLMERINDRFSFNDKMNLPCPNSTQILPKRVQFISKGVYIHRNSCLFNESVGFCGNYNDITVNPCSEINIVFNRKLNGSGQYRAWGIGGRLIKMYNIWLEYTSNTTYLGDDLLAHELGHTLGLEHTFEPQRNQCSDTPVHPNIWATGTCDQNNPQPGFNISNNLMDYNPQQNALTPCQLNIVHNTLHTSLSNYVEYCLVDNTICNQNHQRCNSNYCLRSSANYVLEEAVNDKVCGTTQLTMNARGTYRATAYRIEIVETPLRYSNQTIGATFSTTWINGSPGIIHLNQYFTFQLGKTYRITLRTRNNESCNVISINRKWVTFSDDSRYCASGACCPKGSIIIDQFVDIAGLNSILNDDRNGCSINVCVTSTPIIVPNHFNIVNANLLMPPNGEILVNGNINIRNTNIRACGDSMWNRIANQNPQTNVIVTSDNGSHVISDGLLALDIKSPKILRVKKYRFENNHRSINLWGGNIGSNDIIANQFKAGNLKSNLSNFSFSFSGISTAFTNGQIGNGNNNNRNYFYSFYRAFENFFSKLSIVNNFFTQDIYAIWSNRGEITVRNCESSSDKFGIWNNGSTTSVISSKFTGNIAAIVHANTSRNLTVKSCRFFDVKRLDILAEGRLTNTNTILIEQNQSFNNSNSTSGGYVIYNNSPSNASLIVRQNSLENVSIGIAAYGFHNVFNNQPGIFDQIYDNTIKLSGDIYPSIFGAAYGIFMNNSNFARVHNNTITFVDNPSQNAHTIGIYHEFCRSAIITNNNILGIDGGNYFNHGIMGHSVGIGVPLYRCNIIRFAEKGLTFDKVERALLNESMGEPTQTVGNAFRNVENDTWAQNRSFLRDTTTNEFYYYYFGHSNNWTIQGLPHRWRPANNGEDNLQTSARLDDSARLLGPHPACNYNGGNKRLNNYLAQRATASSEPRLYYAKIELMKEILSDTTLLDSSVIYQQFYSQYRYTNIHKFALAELKYTQDDTLQARQYIQQVLPQDPLETDIQNLLRIKYLGDSISALDSAIIMQAAQLEDSLGLHIIYASTRNLTLNDTILPIDMKNFYVYTDDIYRQGKKPYRKEPLKLNDELFNEMELASGIILYPNPAKDFLQIINSGEDITAQILNAQGQLISLIHLKSGENSIQTNTWANGIYLLKTPNHAIKFIVQN